MTVAAAIEFAARLLREAGVDGPARDARALVSAAAGLDRASIVRDPDARLTPPQQQKVMDFIERRRKREPVSRVLGQRAFYGREFEISPATLDPRPDSETIIEAALELLEEDGIGRDAPLRVIDIGTGSGCLLVTMLAEMPQATGVGTDIAPQALQMAERNALKNDVDGRAAWRLCRSLDGIEGIFDLLVSNPPYIPSGDIAGLDPEVRDYDPLGALDGGADGLEIYRQIAQRLGHVVPGGWAIFEVGAGQAAAVSDLLMRVNGGGSPPDIRLFKDLAGIERCVAWKARC